MMNDILREFLDQVVVVYFEDIFIYSKTEEGHEKLVKRVLQRLMDKGMAGKIDKCEFNVKELDYLRYILSGTGVSVSDTVVQTIQEWKAPASQHDVQIFMGFANFYRRFIRNFSGVWKSIPDTLKGEKTNFVCSKACDIAFRFLKEQFTTAPILQHFDPSKETIMENDASNFAIAGLLSPRHEERLHPTAFFSRKLNPAEMNYEIYNKEMLATLNCFQAWRHYLEGACKKRVSIH